MPPASSKIGAEPPRVFLIDDEPGHPGAPPRPATTPAGLAEETRQLLLGDMGEGEAKGWSAAVEITQRQRGRKGFTRRIAHLYIASQHRCAAATVKSRWRRQEPRTGQLAGSQAWRFFTFMRRCWGEAWPSHLTACGRRGRTTWLRRPRIGPEPAGDDSGARKTVHDYQLRKGIAHQEIMAPEGSAAWLKDRSSSGRPSRK